MVAQLKLQINEDEMLNVKENHMLKNLGAGLQDDDPQNIINLQNPHNPLQTPDGQDLNLDFNEEENGDLRQ